MSSSTNATEGSLESSLILEPLPPLPILPPNKKKEPVLLMNKGVSHVMHLIQEVYETEWSVLSTLNKTPIQNVLDAHYLLTLQCEVKGFYSDLIGVIRRSAEEPGKEGEKEVNRRVGYVRMQVEAVRDGLRMWKSNKFIPDQKFVQRKKKIFKSRWQLHQKELAQKKVMKRAGRKRQEALKRKHQMLKKRGNMLLSLNS